MRKLLNVLYVTTPDSYLSKDGENAVISVNGIESLECPFIIWKGLYALRTLVQVPH